MVGDSGGWMGNLGRRVISSEDSEQDKLNKTLAIFASGLMGFGAMLWLAIYWAMGIKFSATVPLSYLVISAVSLVLYLWKRNFELFRFIQVSLFLFVPFIMQWSIGSYVSSSGVMLWALLAPVGVMIFQGPRDSLPWFFAYIVMTAISGFFDYYLGDGVQQGVTMQSVAVFFSLNFAAVSTIVYFLISYFVNQRDKLQARLDEQFKLLQEEQAKSERLLLNILPGPIAQRLKEQHTTIADGFSDVTVMFADIINFTRLSEEMPPKFMVAMLNEVFSHFDQLAEKHGLEKIKTIGDAYMVAGGLDEHHRATGCRGVGARLLRRDLRHGDRDARLHGNALRDQEGAPADPRRHRHRAGGGGGDRHEEVHLRPVGRYRQHREPRHGAGRPQHDTGRCHHLPARAQSVRIRGPAHPQRQG